MTKYKSIIGRVEIMYLAGRTLAIPAKTDTGAYSSSIHATEIQEITKQNGKRVLRFKLLEGHPLCPKGYVLEASTYETTGVQNSFGERQVRYKVVLKVKIANKVFKAPFTLADRSKKVFPVLLGRTLLNGRFIVDTEVAHVDRTVLKARFKEWLTQIDTEDEEVR